MTLMASDEPGREFDLVTEWHAPLGIIAAFYLMNDWQWDNRGDLRPPTATEIAAKALEMIAELEGMPAGFFLTSGRLKVITDPDFPESFEIYVQVGHASPRVPEGSR